MDTPVSRILDKMKEKGLDQKTFAKEIGVRAPAITEWKKGTSSSYTKFLPQIAQVLDTSVEYLMTGESIKKQPTGGPDGLSKEEADLLDLFRCLPADRQELVVRMVQAAADQQKG